MVEARLVPDVEHRRWGDDVSERGRRGGGLVGVDRVGVADDVAPVPDHRLVDRVAGDVERRAPPDQPPQRVEVEAPGRRAGIAASDRDSGCAVVVMRRAPFRASCPLPVQGRGQRFGEFRPARAQETRPPRADTWLVARQGAESVRIKRTTALALAASAALVIGSGVVASSAILGLPLFGFGGHEATGSAATAASTTVPFGRRPDRLRRPLRDLAGAIRLARERRTRPSKPTAAFASLGGSAAAPPAATTPAPAAGAHRPTHDRLTHDSRDHDDDRRGCRPTTPPPGCREPEWDPEHHVWQCSRGD